MTLLKHILVASLALTPLVSQADTNSMLQKINHQLLSMRNIQTNAWNRYFYGPTGSKQNNQSNTQVTDASFAAYLGTPGLNETMRTWQIQQYICMDTKSTLSECSNSSASENSLSMRRYQGSLVQNLSDQTDKSSYQNSVIATINRATGQNVPAASAILNSLNTVASSYNSTSKSTPSQMQQLSSWVSNGYNTNYPSSLAKSSLLQSSHLQTKLVAEHNAMTYKVIQQNQSIKVLLANVLAQQLTAAKQRQTAITAQNKTNQLLSKLIALHSKHKKRAGVVMKGLTKQEAAEQMLWAKRHLAAEKVKAKQAQQDLINQYYQKHGND